MSNYNIVYFTVDEDITFRNPFDDNDIGFSPARADFLGTLYAQNQDLFQEGFFDPEDIAQSIFEQIEARGKWLWIIYKGEEPVGMIAVDDFENVGDYIHACKLHTLCIKKSHAVKAMIKAAEFILKYLKDRGFKRIYTFIDENNKNGVKFYQNLGFEIEGLLRARVMLRGEPRNEYILSSIFIETGNCEG